MLSVLVIYQAGLHASKHDHVINALSPLHVRISTCSLAGDAMAIGQPLEQEIEVLLAKTDHIIIAGVSLTLLKQLDDLDDSSPLTALILYGLAIGISVSAVRDAIDPRAYLASKGTPTFQISRRLDQRLQALRALGIDLLSLHELKQRYAAPLKTRHSIVTLKDVQTACARGTSLDQLQGHFTPAAQDWLREQGLSRHSSGDAS